MAKRELMCAYNDCTETMVAGQNYKVTISEIKQGQVWDRHAYCCLEHAWRALKAKDERLNGKRPTA